MSVKLIKLVEFISTSSLHEEDHCSSTGNKSVDEYAEFCENIPKCENCAFADIVHKEKFSTTLDAIHEHQNSSNRIND